MKKYLLLVPAILALFCLVTISLPPPVHAVDVLNNTCSDYDPSSPNYAATIKASGGVVPSACVDNKATSDPNNAGANPLVGPNGLLTTYIHILALVVGAGAVVVIILSGLRFATSNGDPAGVTAARNGILYALVGLGVAAVSQAVVTFVIAKV